jgi:hypothetical protein
MKTLLLFPLLLFLFQTKELFAENKKAQEDNLWIVTAEIENTGKLNFYTLLDTTNSPALLKTLKDRDKAVLGSFKARLFRLFQKRKNKSSMAVIELTENGTIDFLAMSMSLKEVEKISKDTISGIIYDSSLKNKTGKLIAVRTHLTKNNLSPFANYQQIADSIIALTDRKIYNPALVKSKGWRQFSNNIRSKSAKIQDDLEFMLLFFSQINKTGFSHYALVKTDMDLEKTLNEPQIECKVLTDSMVYMQFKTLSGRIEEIDSVFTQYAGYPGYIIDLRNTPGGKFETTYRLASCLSQQNNPAGTFVCRRYYEDATFRNNTNNFYVLKEKDFSHFATVLEEKQAVKIVFEPQNPIQSPIYLLIGNRTASACEPLVYGLKGEKNIQIIGEKTAGAMLSPTVHAIGNNYFLIIPTADYLTNQAKSIEGVGVQPDIKVKSEKALEFVLKTHSIIPTGKWNGN